MTEHSSTPDAEQTAAEADPAPDMRMAPGGPRALAQGCVCSVLANAGYRAGVAEHPLVDPRCAMHAEDVAAAPQPVPGS